MAENKADHEEFVEVTIEPDRLSEATSKSSRSIVEVLLDPKTLQGLMACGAGLLVLGLVVWLWSMGVFENRLVVATCLGIGNIAVVAGGMSTVRYTRYQTAGKAMTMLGCLVMPLNLWFYNSQGLITLAQGGHLWVPAVACCLIYTVVARVLKDPKFVFAIVAGVTMTGLLLLADQNVNRFWEILSPSALMVVIGIVCIHAERVFAPGDGPFSREHFGKAFFQAGHAVLASGLLLLLGGRVAGLLYEPFLIEFGWFAKPAVTTQNNLKIFALLLAMAGAYSYVYSQIIVKSRGRYVASAVLTLLWSAVILLDLLAVPFTMALVALLLAGTALALNLATGSRHVSASGENDWGAQFQEMLQSTRWIVSGLHVVVGVLALVLYGRVRLEVLHDNQPFEFDWMYIVAMLLASISCWWSAVVASRSARSDQLERHGQSAAVFAMFFTAGLLAVVGMQLTVITLALEMLIPIGLAAMSFVSRSAERQRAWARAGELAACLVLVAGVAAALGLMELVTVAAPHLWLMLLFGAATLCFGLASVHSQRQMSPVLSAGCLCATVWQFLLLLGFTQYVFIQAATVVGIVCVVLSKVLASSEKLPVKSVEYCRYFGWVGISFGGVAALMLSLGRVLVGEAEWSLLGLMAVQVTAATLATMLTKQEAWRRYFAALAVSEVLISLLAINVLSPLTFLQKGELFVTLGGLVMVGLGYRGWFRETKGQDELVSMNLSLGSFLCAAPMVVGLLHQRFWESAHDWGWVMMHEVGVLAIGLLLLGAGLVCRIRWSTLMGAGTLILYVVSLLGLVQWPDQLQSTAVYMMVGGGAFFGIAVLLSVYRDRLLALPDKVREGEGVFQVLKWR